jgi:cell filamentation protein
MRDAYNYIDTDYAYTDRKTGVLRNKGNITNYEALLFFESGAVTKRSKELEEKPIKIKDAESLLKIHEYLFQDIYEWAGKLRTVEISKQGKQFFPRERFSEAFSYIDSLIASYRRIGITDTKGIANSLAIILDNVNFLHPFREGNGRDHRRRY